MKLGAQSGSAEAAAQKNWPALAQPNVRSPGCPKTQSSREGLLFSRGLPGSTCCKKLWCNPLALFCEVVHFAFHLPPFGCDKFLLARIVVFDSVCNFLVSGFSCAWAARRETRGTSRHVAARSTGTPKNNVPLHFVKQTWPRHVQNNAPGKRRGTSRHVATLLFSAGLLQQIPTEKMGLYIYIII